MPNDDDHEDHDHEIHGIQIPISGGLAAMLASASGAHDRHHMEIDLIQQRIFAFLDGLDVEGCLVMRRILAAGRESASNSYFEGQIVSILRHKHQVDPDTGLTKEEALAATDSSRKDT